MTGTLPVNSSVPDTWVYVDGINRSVQANTTLYLWPGIYNITVVKQDYETPSIQTVNVTEGANPEIDFIPEPALPVAGFVANTTLETATQDVAFIDQSTGVISSWLWDLGDGNTSADQNPIHTYPAVGTYNVSLNASNALGSNISTSNAYITVSAVSTESSDSESSSGSTSSSRLSIITTQAQDAATITDNISEEIPEESIQAKENVSVISEEEKTEKTDSDDIKSTPGFGALAGIVFLLLALIVFRKNK
jgi:PKD repeat protein